jgi:zinc transporter ZupT
MLLSLLVTALAISGIAIGVVLGGERNLPPSVTAAGGGLLFGISLFWVLPEIAGESGWVIGSLALLAGASLLWTVDHYLYPICPSCSAGHDHAHCSGPPLHGFAAPLLIATGIHSFLDGWSIRLLSSGSVSGWLAPLGLALHKVPEGMALGLITRESLSSARRTIAACIAVESLTLVGAALEPAADHAASIWFGRAWISVILAIIGGSFLFLGFHTVHGSRHKPGVVRTFLLTTCGIGALALVHWRLKLL